MRKFITLALMAATAIPAAASAQSNRELQRDRQEIREEGRDLRQAQRYGDRRDVRDARGEVREARQEYREDLNDRNRSLNNRNRNWGRNDWRGYRDNNRNLYARGNWRAPFRYQQFRVGGRIAPNYFGRSYWINDPWRYRLPRTRVNQRWIRHYNDVVLIDYRRGIVIDRFGGFFR